MGVFKNGVGRPSNETIKKRNIFKGICVVLFIVIIGLVVYILNDKGIINISSKDDKKTNNTTKESEELDINSKEVINLYAPFTYYMHEAVDEELYKEDIVMSKDLSAEYRNRLALAKYFYNNKEAMTYDGVITSNDLQKSHIELFGDKVKYEPKTFNSYSIWAYYTIYDEKDKEYHCGDFAGDWTEDRYISELYDAIKYDNKIELYEYVVILYPSSDFKKVGLFNNLSDALNFENPILETDSASKDEIVKKFININEEKVSNGNLKSLKDKVSKYKITFTKDSNGSYIFDKIEKIK